MQNHRRSLLVGGALSLLFLGVFAWMFTDLGAAPERVRVPGQPPSSRRAAPGELAAPDVEKETPRDPDAAHVEFDTPMEAEAFLDRNVLEFLQTVVPETDPDAVSHTCTEDGRHCTFVGPWPGDDFLRRWVAAISDGRAPRADLEGVTFSKLRPETRSGAEVFVLEAHAP